MKERRIKTLVPRLVGKGAEAELYLAEYDGERAVCKRRVGKKYRIPELDSLIREERTKREARILVAVKETGVNCPKLMGINLYGKEIFMSFVPGVLLREKLDLIKGKKLEKILLKMGGDLARIHSRGVVHGDSTTSNMMLDEKAFELTWIDFGLSEFSSSIEEQATDLLLLKKSVSPQQFVFVKKGYSQNNPIAKNIFARLDEIEKRGRYVVRSMAR
ncbi:Kae1-associated serine/threonine protein kinase [Candidatus Micrarchaeota archaeon]|nr:Kae1-associated serine/threonine protein kinase [Candidatus Micrarchaeota archaeon]